MPEQSADTRTASGGPAAVQTAPPAPTSQAPAPSAPGAAQAAPPQQGGPPAQQGDAGQGTSPQGQPGYDPKNDPARSEYWQSRWAKEHVEPDELAEYRQWKEGRDAGAQEQGGQPPEGAGEPEDDFGLGDYGNEPGQEAPAAQPQPLQQPPQAQAPPTWAQAEGEAQRRVTAAVAYADQFLRNGQIPPGFNRPVTQADVEATRNAAQTEADAWLGQQARRFAQTAAERRKQAESRQPQQKTMTAQEVMTLTSRLVKQERANADRLASGLKRAESYGEGFLNREVKGLKSGLPTPLRTELREFMEASKAYDPDLALMFIDKPSLRAHWNAEGVRLFLENEAKRQAAAQPSSGRTTVDMNATPRSIADAIIEASGLATAPR